MHASAQDIANDLAKHMACIAIEAGAAIMRIYRTALKTDLKSDGSLVTSADHAGEAIIVKGLARQFPGIQIVAEEACYAQSVPAIQNRFFLVDALDGTREFVERRPEFTVNIALIEKGKPVAGVVFSPASGELYLAEKKAFSGKIESGQSLVPFELPPLRRIQARKRQTPIVAAVSRTHLDPRTVQFLEEYKMKEMLAVGSSIKFCRIAEGLADIYPRFSPTMEWDTAAGQAIVTAAGGAVLTPDGQPLTYGKPSCSNGPFIAWGK